MRIIFGFLAALMVCGVASAQAGNGAWTFAVSGDSRNCGDVVMPSIARSVKADGADFYWHLGDFRAMQNFDEDMLGAAKGKLSVANYEKTAWDDFLQQQVAAFAPVPVFLGIGNHELVGRTREQFLVQFADWFDGPEVRAQRLKDDPTDHVMKTYFHVRHANVDFVTMDNASPDQFSAVQVAWFEKLLAADAKDPGVRTVVIGMHEAFPDSLSAGHSMNEWPQERESGRRVYRDLLAFEKSSGKEVQVVASHSHFVMSNVYENKCHKADEVLKGWIVGSAGAVRYRLPAEHAAAKVAKTDVYGYLLGSVDAAGHVSFAFHEVVRGDVSAATVERYGKATVDACFSGNKQSFVPEGPECEVR